MKTEEAPVAEEARSEPHRPPAQSRLQPVIVFALLPAVTVVGMLVFIFWVSLGGVFGDEGLGLGRYADVLGDRFTYTVLWNTAGFSIVTVAVAMLFGLPAAWLVERTDLRAKGVVFGVMVLGVLIPGYFSAMGWTFLMHPRIGVVNDLLASLPGIEGSVFNISSVVGMGWVQGLGLAPVVFVMTAATFRSMDPSLEGAASISGAGLAARVRRITLPLARPSLMAAGIYVLTIGVAAFDIPAIIGLPARILTFSTYVFFEINPEQGLPRYGTAATLGAIMVVLGVALTWWYGRILKSANRFAVVTGKNYKPKSIVLGRRGQLVAWAFLLAYILMGKIMPLLLLTWGSLLPFFAPPSVDALDQVSLNNYFEVPWDRALRGMANTGILMLLVPTLTLGFSIVLSWVTLKSRFRWRFAFDYVAFLPHAVPNIIFAVAALIITLRYPIGQFDLYESLSTVVIVFATAWLAFGTRVVNSGLLQMHADLGDAARVSGARLPTVLRTIILPLLKPTLVYAWLWIAMLSFRELTMPAVLASPENMTLSVTTWSLWTGGDLGPAAALTMVTLVLLLPLVAIYWRVSGHGRAQV